MNNDKARGPMAFFQAYWDVIKDVMRVFHTFHARSKFESLNDLNLLFEETS